MSQSTDDDISSRSQPAAGGAPTGEFLPWDDPAFLLDPYPWFARVQREAPVFLDPSGTYIVTRYADVVEFGKHPAMSVEPGWDQAGPWALARETVIGLDPPEHTRLRRLSNSWFTPKMVKEWARTTAQATTDVLDGLEGDLVDGWHQLSVIPTHRTMCRVLQVAEGDVEAVKVAMERSMPMLRVRTRPGEVEMAEESFEYLLSCVQTFLDDKRTTPGDGLTDALLGAVEQEHLTEQQMIATLTMLYGLGHMDVGYAVASALYAMARHPDVFAEFRAHPEIRERVVNETIRLDAPELSFYRTTKEDLTIRGVDIPAGSLVRFMIAAANRDPDAFDNPDRLDHTRPMEHSHNLSFGIGPHSCAGQVISRAEVLTVLETVASRFSRIEVAGEVVMDNTDFSRHFKKLPLRLVP